MEDEARSYFEEVEEHFLARIGRPLILSPEDVEAILGWWQEGIPLEAVRQGIDGHLARIEANPRRKRRARAVRFCDEDVRDAWEDLRVARLGDRRGDGIEDPDRIRRVLARAAEGLREADAAAEGRGAESLARRCRACADEVEGLAVAAAGKPADPEELEGLLQGMDAALLLALRESAPGDVAEAGEEAGRRLADVRERMEPRSFERTKETLAERLLRERHRLPRLSLYAY